MNPMNFSLLAYLNPDNALPVTSALATAAGFVMMLWPRLKATVERWLHLNRQGDQSAIPAEE